MVFSIKQSDTFTSLLKANLHEKYKNKRRSNDVAHVSDLVEGNCIYFTLLVTRR